MGVASEAVEFSDGDHVTLADVVQASVHLRAVGGRAAYTMVGEDARRPSLLKCVELKLGILISRRISHSGSEPGARSFSKRAKGGIDTPTFAAKDLERRPDRRID